MGVRRRFIAGLVPVLAAGSLAVPAAHAGIADPLFDQQWAMQSDGPLDAPGAWRYGTGTGQVVAVLDSGVDASHPDLQGQLWTNPGEIPGNGIDDDHDGFVDDVHGADLVNHDGDPADDNGHGTHVAGIIAARRDAIGTVGLAPGAQIMAVKVLDAHADGDTDTVAQGVRYAIAHGATVINLSLNANADDPGLDDAIAAANSAGITVVTAAGNYARNIDSAPSWPASSPEPNLVSVAATRADGLLAAFSDFGAGTVSLAAPGTDIASTAMGGGYESRDGTSMAAPEVAATLALMQAAAPDASPATLRSALLATTRRPGGLAGLLRTGEVDPVAALAAVAQPLSDPLAVTGRVRKRGTARTLVTWQLSGDQSAIASFRVSGAGGRTLSRAGSAKRGAWVAQRSGRVRITALDTDGNPLAAATVTLAKSSSRGAR